MAGYADTKKLIEDTLVGRPAGSLIYPEGHQAMAMSLLDYIHSVELLGASELQGIATTSTVPVQPDNAKVSYIATVPAGQTYVFTNFHDENGNSISITTGANTISLLTFLWNGEYWQVQNNQIQLMLNITAGYLYAGVAIPTTNPGSPDEPVFYIAAQAGTYANFGGIVVNDGEAAILKYVNSSWVKEVSGLATREEVSRLGHKVGDLDDLETEDKSSLVDAINEAASKESLPTEDIEDADLEFRDENRNILVRFANGHIQTKNFNSAEGGGGGTKELRVLFLGNSLTQDAISYLPLLLKEVAPELKFHFYIFYNGGINLATQYANYLQTPTRNCGIFSEYSSEDDAWTNYSNSKNMNWVIANCNFDVLVLQEYGNNGQSDSAIIDAFNNCSDWFFNNYKKPIKVCNMMDAPARSDVSGVTTRIENYAKLAYGSCYSQGIIPAGRAISYACEDSELSGLGDSGYLSPDGVHAQEGLPCLLQSYVVAMWLFDHLGMNKSIWGSQTRITTAVYTAQNVPGANLGTGVVTGTEAQHLAAQKCAIKALKRGRALEIETLNV